ncbi:MAG: 4-hydroxy-tetrahydrodipicolinate synthase [Pseudomonadota bacterium]
MIDLARIKGSIPALVTPFKDGQVDEAALRRLVDWQITEGSHGLVPVGTTGESPTLSHEEHRRVVTLCVEAAAGRVPVIAGCGSNNTAEAIGLLEHAEKAGADAALVVCPYYNKPNQEGLYQHYATLAQATGLPIIIYNIPGRVVVDMLPETMGRLARDFANIVGVKDATGNAARVSAQRRACGTGFIQLSGNDDMTLGLMAMGAVGSISVTANVAPRLCARFHEACLEGDFTAALALQDRLYPLHDGLFCEPSPGPIKYAMHRLGLCAPDVRLPLVAPTDKARALIDAAMKHAGLVA